MSVRSRRRPDLSPWAWIVAAYARPGVAEACLALQDDHRQNVSLVLWAAWAGDDDASRLARACVLARAWDAAVLLPIRSARRNLKGAFEGVDNASREALYGQAKALELQAERLLIEALEAQGKPDKAVSAEAAMIAACQAWGNPPPAHVLASLAALMR